MADAAKAEEPLHLSIGQALDYGIEMALHGNHESAIGLFTGVLMHDPDNVEALLHLGASQFEINRIHEAFFNFWRARELKPRDPQALTNFGACLLKLDQNERGIADLERAVYHAKGNKTLSDEAMAMLYNNLGNALERLRRYPEALKALEEGLAFRPDDAFANYNRGIVLLRLNRRTAAIEAFNRTIAANPDDADAHYNRGMAYLAQGDFKQGWPDYEYRLVTTENKKLYLGMPPEKLWSGQSLEGKTLLVHGEQGLGDDIQFFRFLPPLAKKHPGAELKLICHAATKPIAPACVSLLNTGEPLPSYDYWVALMSLPLLLGIDADGKLPPPYQYPIERDRFIYVRQMLALPPDKLNVGICWAGNWLHKNDHNRSIPLNEFATMFNTADCNFVSVQQMREGEQQEFARIKEGRDNLKAYLFNDFRDTAAALTNLDIVVSVDTAVAHLAASHAVPTILLLPAQNTDWRWQINRPDSPWYPSMTLYRQHKVGEWGKALQVVHAKLEITALYHRADRLDGSSEATA